MGGCTQRGCCKPSAKTLEYLGLSVLDEASPECAKGGKINSQGEPIRHQGCEERSRPRRRCGNRSPPRGGPVGIVRPPHWGSVRERSRPRRQCENRSPPHGGPVGIGRPHAGSVRERSRPRGRRGNRSPPTWGPSENVRAHVDSVRIVAPRAGLWQSLAPTWGSRMNHSPPRGRCGNRSPLRGGPVGITRPHVGVPHESLAPT